MTTALQVNFYFYSNIILLNDPISDINCTAISRSSFSKNDFESLLKELDNTVDNYQLYSSRKGNKLKENLKQNATISGSRRFTENCMTSTNLIS
jgi:hypothetical protein